MGGIVDAIGKVVSGVGDAIGNVVDNVVHNPIGAIVDVGLMSVGVPPIVAGALGGASNAIVNHTDILQGALTGGAMAGLGGLAGTTATGLGASSTMAAIATGATAGATGAILTGQDILKGALGGGLLGGAAAAVQTNTGTTYKFDDGSSITRYNDGSVSATTANGQSAPVSDLSGPKGGLIPTADGNFFDTQTGATVDANSNIIKSAPTATTTTVPSQGETLHFDDGTWLTINPDGSTSGVDTSGQTFSHNGGTSSITNGDTTYKYDDGSSLTVHADGSTTSVDTEGNSVTKPAGQVTVGDTTGTTTEPTSTAPTDTSAPGWTPVTPIVPVVTPTPTPTNNNPDTNYTPPTSTGGTITPANTSYLGLNPGFIAPTPFYHTTSPVQSEYYWGVHPMQTGTTFNAQQYNNVPQAPAHQWGLQELAAVPQAPVIPFNIQDLYGPYGTLTPSTATTAPAPVMPAGTVSSVGGLANQH